jgi:hypothetical protein
MKKLITICLLVAATFTVNAQQKPTFEETLEYINAMFKENEIILYPGNSSHGYQVIKISVEKSGKIIAYKNSTDILCSFNLFDIKSFDFLPTNNYNFLNSKKESQYLAYFGRLNLNAGKLEKALTHLRTLCVKSVDPFGE